MAQPYPLPRFHFRVDWGGSKISFTEVTGMDFQVEVIEYRHSDDNAFNKIKMPGMRKFSNITMKRGVFEGDTDYYKWLQEISNERATARRTLTITLLNEKHAPIVVYDVYNAFPVKVTIPDLKSDANEVAIEAIEIAHEGIKMR